MTAFGSYRRRVDKLRTYLVRTFEKRVSRVWNEGVGIRRLDFLTAGGPCPLAQPGSPALHWLWLVFRTTISEGVKSLRAIFSACSPVRISARSKRGRHLVPAQHATGFEAPFPGNQLSIGGNHYRMEQQPRCFEPALSDRPDLSAHGCRHGSGLPEGHVPLYRRKSTFSLGGILQI